MLICFVDCCLTTFNYFVLLVETFVPIFGLVPLFSAAPGVDYDSAFLASASFRWLLLVPSRRSYRFALICAHFSSVTTLCGPLKGPGHLFDQFPTICNHLLF
jgi:hypothetical protein